MNKKRTTKNKRPQLRRRKRRRSHKQRKGLKMTEVIMLLLAFSFLISDKELTERKKISKKVHPIQIPSTMTKMTPRMSKRRKLRKVSQTIKVVFNQVLYL
jgi:hypothetical protein